MARKIYWATVWKWITKNKIAVGSGTGLTIIGLFLYLSTIGAITIHGVSDDVVCAGTEEDPCYAYINFTANEDIYIYPLAHDPWGRATPFQFDKEIKDFKLQRSWGKSWRTMDLTKPWSKVVKYAVKFKKGQTYEIRIRVLKESPLQDVKWWSDAWGVEDPVFVASKNLTIVHPCIKNKTITHKKIDKCWEVTHTALVPCTPFNETCLLNKTSGKYYKIITWQTKECNYTYWNTTECAEYSKKKEIQYGDKLIPEELLGTDCVYDGKNICCVDPNDDDGSGICRYGKTYAYWIPGNKMDYEGTYKRKAKLINNFVKEGIETAAVLTK